MEGYATALSLKLRLGAQGAFSDTRDLLCQQSEKMAATCPGALVVADNDESGTGERAAQESGC